MSHSTHKLTGKINTKLIRHSCVNLWRLQEKNPLLGSLSLLAELSPVQPEEMVHKRRPGQLSLTFPSPFHLFNSSQRKFSTFKGLCDQIELT